MLIHDHLSQAFDAELEEHAAARKQAREIVQQMSVGELDAALRRYRP